MVSDVLIEWRAMVMEPPGRFLAKHHSPTTGGSVVWHEVGDERARFLINRRLRKKDYKGAPGYDEVLKKTNGSQAYMDRLAREKEIRREQRKRDSRAAAGLVRLRIKDYK